MSMFLIKNEKPANVSSKNITDKNLLNISLSKNLNPTSKAVKPVNVSLNNSLSLNRVLPVFIGKGKEK